MPEWPTLAESVERVKEGCPDGLACLTIDGIAEFTDWVKAAKFWKSQAELRCGQKEDEE
jgi:hypothetical protein